LQQGVFEATCSIEFLVALFFTSHHWPNVQEISYPWSISFSISISQTTPFRPEPKNWMSIFCIENTQAIYANSKLSLQEWFSNIQGQAL
jgi:hypothetical protein